MKETANHKFVSKLKELDVRPEVIAVALNKTARTVNSWRSGAHMPKLTPREMAKFCSLLGVSIDELAELFEPEDT